MVIINPISSPIQSISIYIVAFNKFSMFFSLSTSVSIFAINYSSDSLFFLVKSASSIIILWITDVENLSSQNVEGILIISIKLLTNVRVDCAWRPSFPLNSRGSPITRAPILFFSIIYTKYFWKGYFLKKSIKTVSKIN